MDNPSARTRVTWSPHRSGEILDNLQHERLSSLKLCKAFGVLHNLAKTLVIFVAEKFTDIGDVKRQSFQWAQTGVTQERSASSPGICSSQLVVGDRHTESRAAWE